MVSKKPPTSKSTNRKLHLVKPQGTTEIPLQRAKKGTKAEVINIDKKINEAIQIRLGKFVKEIQDLKKKQKKLEAFQKAKVSLSTTKKKKKNKHSPTPKRKR